MKTVIHRNIAKTLGVNPVLIKSLRHIPRYLGDLRKYKRLAVNGGLPVRIGQLFPIISDYKDTPLRRSLREAIIGLIITSTS